MKNFAKRVIQKLIKKTPEKPQENYEFLKSEPRYQKMTVDLLNQKFKIADALSFYWSYREIFEEKIYKFDSPKEAPVILDCGSNYGTSIIFFKQLYPNSKITAIEPDPNIFQLLEWNTQQRNFDDVTLINKAISNEPSSACFYSEGADAGRIFPIKENQKIQRVSTVQLDDLIPGHVDFLKMDIEGAETEAICSSKKLKNIDQMFIEYHSFEQSEQLLDSLLQKLKSCGFRYYIHTQFCSPRPLTEEALQVGMDLQLNIFAKRSS